MRERESENMEYQVFADNNLGLNLLILITYLKLKNYRISYLVFSLKLETNDRLK